MPMAAWGIDTITERFSPPSGYKRLSAKGFGHYLQTYPLMPKGTEVTDYKNRPVWHTSAAAVLDLDIGHKNLQQCADTIIRLYADYTRQQGAEKSLSFKFTSGQIYRYQDFLDGLTPKPSGNTVIFSQKPPRENTDKNYRRYLDYIFTYVGTASLARDLKKIPVSQAKVGDLFINPGFPGHATVIADMVINTKGDKKIMMIQGFMPAQSAHIVKSLTGDVWFDLGGPLTSQLFTFKGHYVYRFNR